MRALFPIVAGLVFVAGCGSEAESTPAEPFAVLDVGRGSRVSFTELEGGGIAVGEVGPAADLDYVSNLAVRGATPLEMWLALSEEEVPEALIENHLAFGAELGAPAEPRRFTFEVPEANTADLVVDQLYGATCTLASDGAWFDNTWQSAGWNWHWYWSNSASSSKYSPRTASTSLFHTHLCNYARGPSFVQHCADGDLPWNVACQDVPIGDRSVFVVLGDTDVWRGLQTGWVGNSGNYKLGAMAP